MKYTITKRDLELLAAVKTSGLNELLHTGAVPAYSPGSPLCEYIRETAKNIALLIEDIADMEGK
jgi:hypothetical protein